MFYDVSLFFPECHTQRKRKEIVRNFGGAEEDKAQAGGLQRGGRLPPVRYLK